MDYQTCGFLHEQFVTQARKTPGHPAVVDVNHLSVTYGELDEMTDGLASIMQKRRVREGVVVAIHMDKCLQYVIGYIAILKAGGVYLPMDVSYPPCLISDIMAEAEPLVVLTKKSFLGEITGFCQEDRTNFIILDDISFRQDIKSLSSGLDYAPPKVTLESPAFVAYSSGTTGKPKGIVVPLRAPILSYKWRHDAYPYVGEEREAANVFFVWELLRPLMKGQTLYVIPDDTIYDPPKLLQFLQDHCITRMLFTPSLLETVLDFPLESVSAGFRTMRQVWLCGEVTTTSMMERAMRTLPHIQFINLYSISECHDVSAINLTKFYKEKPEKLKESKFTPVGQLLPNVKVLILDKDLKVQPVGVSGEMYVYGPTLAIGYLKRPEITSQKFVTLPVDDEGKKFERMYKTGDWGYLLSDRGLEICGRCDLMVKIRGYSIEVSAIENAILGLNCVQSCVVLPFGEEGQDKYLVAYIVTSKSTSVRRIRGELKRRLPFYMIPSYFLFISEIPILAGSGKLDKKALPPLNKDDIQNKPEFSPKTETEKKLAEIWSSVLHISSIDVQESFFDLGGHSLLAAKLLQIVNDHFNSNLSVKEMYTSPTITSMARLIDGKAPKGEVVMDLSKEVEIHSQYDSDLDIQLRAFWRFSNFNKTRWSSACVLLTGSTGYLGAFLLSELLRSTESHIFCLIRENLDTANSQFVVEIEKRLFGTMKQYHLINDNESEIECFENVFKQRVTIFKGDVSLINFGLLDDDYRYLSTEIDYIIHAAAYVNLTYPYSALYSANVLGTCNILKFASHFKIKPLHYVSTDAVFPQDFHGREDSDISKLWKKLNDGYGQSKWVAEQIVSLSSKMGYPVIIYRLGNQAPDSVNAALNTEDFNFMMIRSFFHLGCIPNIDWSLEMTPVNFTATVIVECAKSLSTNVGKVYHLINEKPLKMSTLRKSLARSGFVFESVSYDNFLERMKNSNVAFISKLYSMLSEVARTPQYFKDLPHHDSRVSRKALEAVNLAYPEVNLSLLTLYFTRFLEQNIIPKPKVPEPKYKLFEIENLRGKVAIVTGASSGIGEETAIHLARSGCLVALLARREDKLNVVRDTIQALGGRAMVLKVDVSKEGEVETAVNLVESTLGPIDILVNSAGTMFYQHVYKPQMSDCTAMIDVNVKGLLLCTSKVLPAMVSRKSGHIVNISSDAGKVGFPGLAVYSGTKFFVEGYSQSLRKEVSQFNIRVTCIQPGDVATPLQQSSLADISAANEFSPKEGQRILEARDIAKTIVFALSFPSYVAVNELLVEPTSAPI